MALTWVVCIMTNDTKYKIDILQQGHNDPLMIVDMFASKQDRLRFSLTNSKSRSYKRRKKKNVSND